MLIFEVAMDENTARQMIIQIGVWLKEGAPGTNSDRVYDTVAADLAREFSRNLLKDANANKMGGCPLCQT